MANYLYNGVELPDINEVWTDKETYPYAQICFSDGAAIAEEYSGERVAALVISASKVTCGTYKESYFSIKAPWKHYLYTDSQSIVEHYASVGLSIVCNEWSLVAESTTGDEHIASADGETYWSNHDILNMDGTVYLAASDPVPVTEEETTPTVSFDLKSWLIGFALGLCGKPLPFVKQTPTGYSYNGVVLPELPEWDRGSYPYVCMNTKVFYLSTAIVYFLPSLEYGTDPDTGNWCVMPSTGFLSASIDYSVDNPTWGEVENSTADGIAVANLKWSNFDLLNEDGTVYLAANEPVPVYE